MPAKGKAAPPLPPHAQPRTVWENAFQAEVKKLRPHLAEAPRLLAQITVTWFKAAGDGDPRAAAKRYAETTKR